MGTNRTVPTEEPVVETLETTSALRRPAAADLSNALRELLADVFALYIKTKAFHWHMTGRHFRDYHLLLDEQAEQLFAVTDDLAERSRKLGARTIRSIGDIARHQRLKDNDEEEVTPKAMLSELCIDNRHLTNLLLSTHRICEQHADVATASLIETWIDEAQRRSWFLSEIVQHL